MATSVVIPRVQFFANNGKPLIGGRIHTFVAGSSTRSVTYKDAAKTQPNMNPILLDGRGEAAIYLAEGVEYKFVLEDAAGALILTQEPVYGAVWPNAAEWPSDATLSYQYMTEAKAVADTVGPIKFYDTLAQAEADIANLTEGDVVEIAVDSEHQGARTRRKFLAGALVFAANLDQLRQDLGSPAMGGALVSVTPGGTGQDLNTALKARAVLSDFPDASSAMQFAGRVEVRNDATIAIPNDSTTLQAAIDKLIPASGVKITLLIKAGHKLTKGVSVADGNYGQFRIKSEDAVVQVDSGFVPSDDSVIFALRATAPALMCRINALNKSKYGYHLKDKSFGSVDELCGVDNCSTGSIEGAGLHLNGACVVSAYRAIFNGSYRNCWVAHESLCMSDRANFDGATGDAGLYSARGSIVGVSYGSVSNCQGHGIRARRARVVAMAGTYKSNGLSGQGYSVNAVEVAEVIISQGGPTDNQGSDLSGSASGAVYADNARINVMNSNLSGPNNSISAHNGSVVAAHNSLLHGATRGVYATTGSVVVATGGKITGTASEAILAQGAKVIFDSANSQVTNCNRGLCADYGGEIIANLSSISGSTNENVRARQGSKINVQSATLTGGTYGINATQNSDVDATSAVIQNASLDGISADGTSRVHGQSANVTGSGRYGAVATYGGQIVTRSGSFKNSGVQDLRVQKGGQIHAASTSTTAGSGSPALENTNVAAFNAWTANGVIFN